MFWHERGTNWSLATLGSFFLVAQEQTIVFPEPNALGPAGTDRIIMFFEILVVWWLEH